MEFAVRGSNSSRGKRVSFLQIRPDWLWGPPSLLFDGYRGPLLEIKRLVREAHYSPLSSTILNIIGDTSCMFSSSLLFKGYRGSFPGREPVCSPPSSAGVKNTWSHTSARYMLSWWWPNRLYNFKSTDRTSQSILGGLWYLFSPVTLLSWRMLRGFIQCFHTFLNIHSPSNWAKIISL